MSRFDVILLSIAGLIAAVVATDAWLIIHGFEQFSAGMWTFLTALSGGEVVTFSIYRMVKRVGENLPKTIAGKHPLIKELEDEENGQVPRENIKP